MQENKKISLCCDTINSHDIDNLIDWLKAYPKLTKGNVTVKLEEKWSNWLGTDYSIFCNSGSSANLLMLWSLVEANRISRDAKVVVPSLSWATDLAPVVQLGMNPILCDCNLEDFSVDLNHLQQLFEETKTDVLLLVSVLGFVPDMEKIVELCNKYNVILLEDICEGAGSSLNNKKLGTYGLMSSFSTFFAHHISTIEGGFVSTNDPELYEILKCIRSHGWSRDCSSEFDSKLKSKWNTSDFDSLYTFYFTGFNVRSTDLQAFIGLGQIDKLDTICNTRNTNYNLYNKLLYNYNTRGFISNFAYPVINKNKKQIIEELTKYNIEMRPIICGSIGTQPFFVKRYGRQKLTNSSIVDEYGFYVPNHLDLKTEDIHLISSIINKFK